ESRHLHRSQHHRRQSAIRVADPGERDAQIEQHAASAILMLRRVLVLIACGSALVAAQQPGQTPVFRSGARLNVVDVTVTDKQGKPIDGLTANDFVLTEDGEPQTISQVAFQRIEIDPAVDRPLPPAPPPPPRAASAAPAVQPTIAASTAGAIRY